MDDSLRFGLVVGIISVLIVAFYIFGQNSLYTKEANAFVLQCEKYQDKIAFVMVRPDGTYAFKCMTPNP